MRAKLLKMAWKSCKALNAHPFRKERQSGLYNSDLQLVLDHYFSPHSSVTKAILSLLPVPALRGIITIPMLYHTAPASIFFKVRPIVLTITKRPRQRRQDEAAAIILIVVVVMVRVRRVGVPALQLSAGFFEVRSELVLVVGFVFENVDATKHVGAYLLAVVDLNKPPK